MRGFATYVYPVVVAVEAEDSGVVAPRIVDIAYHLISGGIEDTDYIILAVADIVVVGSVVVESVDIP